MTATATAHDRVARELLAGRTHWNQNANYVGPTRYAAERGHHAALAAGDYWLVLWTNDRTDERLWSDLSAQPLALAMAKDLVHNPGFADVWLVTVKAGKVVRIAEADAISEARF